MEGSFESGGMSSGSSTGGGQMGSGFDSGTEMGSFEVAQSSPSLDSGGMTWEGYLKDGVDKGFYKVDEEGVFGLEDVMMDAQNEMSRDEMEPEESEWDFMNIPGTAHEKLSTFSEMSDKELEKDEIVNDEENNSGENIEEEKEEKFSTRSGNTYEKTEESAEVGSEISFEQEIIKFQAEAIKLLAQSMNKELDKKGLEEIIKKLKELLEKTEEKKGSSKENIMEGALGIISLILTITEEGYKKLENEVQEVEK